MRFLYFRRLHFLGGGGGGNPPNPPPVRPKFLAGKFVFCSKENRRRCLRKKCAGEYMVFGWGCNSGWRKLNDEELHCLYLTACLCVLEW
jgi:hypothetical protein